MASPDIYYSTCPTVEDIHRAAEDHRLELDPLRTEHLLLIGNDCRSRTLAKEGSSSHHQGEFPTFKEKGLEIGLATKAYDVEYFNVGINFIPEIDGVRYHSQVPKEFRCITALNAALALQNFCILAEAGFIRRPSLMSGLTNIQMARVARRAGLVILEAKLPSSYGVQARYQDVVQKLFSEKTKRLLRRLEKASVG